MGLFSNEPKYIVLGNKQIIDESLQEYFERRKAEIDLQLKTQQGEQEIAYKKLWHKEMAEYEHKFHSDHEERGIELAKIEAQIIEKKKYLKELEENNTFLKEYLMRMAGSIAEKE